MTEAAAAAADETEAESEVMDVDGALAGEGFSFSGRAARVRVQLANTGEQLDEHQRVAAQSPMVRAHPCLQEGRGFARR